MYATYMLNSGGDLAAVSAMLGHSDVSLTANTYYQAMSKEKQRSANLLPTLNENIERDEKFQARRSERAKESKPKKKKRKSVTKLGYKDIDS